MGIVPPPEFNPKWTKWNILIAIVVPFLAFGVPLLHTYLFTQPWETSSRQVLIRGLLFFCPFLTAYVLCLLRDSARHPGSFFAMGFMFGAIFTAVTYSLSMPFLVPLYFG